MIHTVCESFKPPLSLSLHAPADCLRETSFVEEPPEVLTVREGDTRHVPCVINTTEDTNTNQVYWSSSTGRASIGKVSDDAATNPACETYHSQYGRVFYTVRHRHVHNESQTELLEATLHLCQVQVQDSGVYHCRHPDASRKMTLQVERG